MKNKKYAWHQDEHDKTPYGEALAQKVADYLMKGGIIANNHRDYCGMGLFYTDSKFYYGGVNDGYLVEPEKTFDTTADFVAWLSVQNDFSMSGRGEKGVESWGIDNQRITKGRLENLAPIEENPEPPVIL